MFIQNMFKIHKLPKEKNYLSPIKKSFEKYF